MMWVCLWTPDRDYDNIVNNELRTETSKRAGQLLTDQGSTCLQDSNVERIETLLYSSRLVRYLRTLYVSESDVFHSVMSLSL